MAFRVSRVEQEEERAETRVLPASAAVLAMRWIERGSAGVTITDNAGRRYSIEAFRLAITRRKSRSTPF